MLPSQELIRGFNSLPLYQPYVIDGRFPGVWVSSLANLSCQDNPGPSRFLETVNKNCLEWDTPEWYSALERSYFPLFSECFSGVVDSSRSFPDIALCQLIRHTESAA